MKIIFLPKYSDNAPSSRYRTYQYLRYFEMYSIQVFPLFDKLYIENLYNKKKVAKSYVFKRYFKRLCILFKIKKNDIVYLEKEFFPYLPFFALGFKIFKINYIVDYDDAIFHNYTEHRSKVVRFFLSSKISKVIKNAKFVITGSPYLTSYALQFNDNIIEIPTSIDIKKYPILNNRVKANKLIIGWIGSPTTSVHLEEIVPALNLLNIKQIDFELRLLGYSNNEINLENLPVKILKWSEQNETSELMKFDVGIMPMKSTPFTKGKCAFKLIQYMSCGIPTISSSFEANIKLDKNKENFFADTTNEWLAAFEKIINNRDNAKKIGVRNRDIVCSYYTIQVNSNKILNIVNKLIYKNSNNL